MRDRYSYAVLHFLVTILVVVIPVGAFFSVPIRRQLILPTPLRWGSRRGAGLVVRLAAKKQATGSSSGRKSNSRRGTGGFGSAPASESKSKASSNNEGDYSVFPRLESRVIETLVPAPPTTMASGDSSGDLPLEIYQRLDQIYGLPNFNYETATDATPLSLSNVLSVDEIEPGPVAVGTASGHTPLPLDSIPPFSKFRILHVDPLVISVDDFFTPDECDSYVKRSLDGAMHARSPTVGKDAMAQSQRTSTTWYHHYEAVPELMAKATRLLGLDNIDRWEEPQTVRYRRKEKFTWHLDALGPIENQPHLGGQRTATLLVYLTDLLAEDGGATVFRDLSIGGGAASGPLKVQPRKGSALLFFPSAGGIPDTPFDIRTLHCGEAVAADALHDKWIGQLWLRHGVYRPSAPPGNDHAAAEQAVADYCQSFQ